MIKEKKEKVEKKVEKKVDDFQVAETPTLPRFKTVLNFLVDIVDPFSNDFWYEKAKPETKKLHKEIRNLIAETFGVTDENLYALVGANRTNSEKDFCKTYRFLLDIYCPKVHRSDYEMKPLDNRIYFAIADLFKISNAQIDALNPAK
jgi:uncharacterized tellurite resistance protein B-like protein